jgi:hypothetical protein
VGELLHAVGEQIAQAHPLALDDDAAGLDARDVEQVADQGGGPLGLVADGVDGFDAGLVGQIRFVPQQFAVQADVGQGCLELMGDVGDELVAGAGGQQLVGGFPQDQQGAEAARGVAGANRGRAHTLTRRFSSAAGW